MSNVLSQLYYPSSELKYNTWICKISNSSDRKMCVMKNKSRHLPPEIKAKTSGLMPILLEIKYKSNEKDK